MTEGTLSPYSTPYSRRFLSPRSTELLNTPLTSMMMMLMKDDEQMVIDVVSEYIDKMPLANTPEVFGLHPNAEIGYYTSAAKEMWSHLTDLQPQTGHTA